MIKRAENIYPETAQDGSTVGVVASYVHGKVGTDVTPANIEVRALVAFSHTRVKMHYFKVPMG